MLKANVMPEKNTTEKTKDHNQTITVKQIASPIGRQKVQRQTLIGLGLNKINKTRTLENTPSIRGMVAKIPHLVKIIDHQ